MDALNLAGSSLNNKRRKQDFYPTPPEATKALIDTGLILGRRVWEPACGDGRMAEVFRAAGYSCTASDIRETGYGLTVPVDFLRDQGAYPCGFFDAIVTNPPFNLAAEFIDRAIDHHRPKVVAMLLKANYWHAAKRIKLFEKHQPSHILALTWRLDFVGGERGGNPLMDCAWVVWTEGAVETKYALLKKPETQLCLSPV